MSASHTNDRSRITCIGCGVDFVRAAHENYCTTCRFD